MRRSLLVAALAFLWLPAVLHGSGRSESTRGIIDSGHAGAVKWLESDDKRGLLFSSGTDGTVRVWDPADGNLLRTLQVTQLETGRIAVSPSESKLAVAITDGSGANYLAVWDWGSEKELYRLPIKEPPLFLRFSALGTYILYGISSWQGLTILKSSDGSELGFHPEGFGTVGLAEMSRTEKTLMTYMVSGRLVYWDLATGNRTLDLPAEPYLSDVRISRDRSVFVGFTAGEVVRVDAVSGAVRGRAPAPGVVSLDISPSGDEIACITSSSPRPLRWRVSGDALVQTADFPVLQQAPVLLSYGPDAVFFAAASGNLASLDGRGQLAPFGGNAVASLTGFDVGQGMLALGSREWVRVLSTDMLSASAPAAAIRTLLVPNPFGDSTGLSFVGPARLLAWGTGSSPAPGLALLDPRPRGATASRAFASIASPFRAPLSALRASAEELIGTEAGGAVRIVDPLTGASRFDSRIAGADAAVRISAGEIIAARNATAGPQGSLIRLNMATGETVAIRDRNLFTYALLLDQGLAGQGPVLYSIGIDAARSTNLVRHDGPDLERETLLDSVPEEDLDASLSLDPDRHVLYAALGRDRTVAWDGRALKRLVLENSVPRQIAARDGLVFCLNKDSTITVADGLTGARRAQIALFTDGEWCVVFADGRYAASAGGDLHVRVFSDGSPVKATDDYRLRIQAE